MIVYVNGGFGVGKTTVCELLLEQLQPAVLFDPESVGGMLSEMLANVDRRGDFQEYPIWLDLTQAVLRALRRAYPTLTIVVPMSILEPARCADAVARMRDVDADFRDVTLVAQSSELARRIHRRPLPHASREWCLEHLHAAPSMDTFADSVAIDTTRMTPQEVAASILATFGAPS